MDAKRLRQAGRRMLDAVARELADAHEARVLTAEEERAEIETWLTLADNGNGTFSGRFVIPELHGHLLRAALEALTSPAQLSRNRAGEPVRDEAVALRPGRNGSERLGHGFTELIEHLPTSADGIAGGFTRNALTLLVHVDHQHLLDGLASARLDTGVHLSAGEARRLACNAGLLPSSWAAPPRCSTSDGSVGCTPSRSAGPCRSPTTRVPPKAASVPSPGATSTTRTRGAAVARTDLDNAVPLCGFHHRRAHDPRFDLTRLADRRGPLPPATVRGGLRGSPSTDVGRRSAAPRPGRPGTPRRAGPRR